MITSTPPLFILYLYIDIDEEEDHGYDMNLSEMAEPAQPFLDCSKCNFITFHSKWEKKAKEKNYIFDISSFKDMKVWQCNSNKEETKWERENQLLLFVSS